MSIIITMADTVPGREIAEVVGVARGNIVRSRFFARDIVANLRSLVGGEIDEYTKLLGQSRDEALIRMRDHAIALGADAVVTMRLSTSNVMEGAAEVLAYGTAVKLK